MATCRQIPMKYSSASAPARCSSCSPIVWYCEVKQHDQLLPWAYGSGVVVSHTYDRLVRDVLLLHSIVASVTGE